MDHRPATYRSPALAERITQLRAADATSDNATPDRDAPLAVLYDFELVDEAPAPPAVA